MAIDAVPAQVGYVHGAMLRTLMRRRLGPVSATSAATAGETLASKGAERSQTYGRRSRRACQPVLLLRGA